LKKAVQERAWKDFADWCAGRGLRALPAHPWTVAYYARWCEQRHRHRTILKRMKAISRVHLLNCHKPPDRHPVVARTLRLLEQRPQRKRQSAALFRPEDFLDAQTGSGCKSARKTGLAKKKRPNEAEASAVKRVMRTTPKLVSRRPSFDLSGT
jgi:hypothetical protein